MSTISIIGTGNMANAIGSLAIKGGNTVEVIGRDPEKAAHLTAALGSGATTGTYGSAPAGDIVILAVLYQSAVSVVHAFGDGLANKVLVDITNPFNDTGTGLAIPEDTSVAKMVAEAAPSSAHVLKAFNTLFSPVLTSGHPVDVFMAGNDEEAKARLAQLITSMGLRPRDTGGLSMAHWVEDAGLLTMGLARYGVGNYDFALGVNQLD